MFSELITAIKENAAYFAEFSGIIVGMFLIAYAIEKAGKKRIGDTERILTTRKIVIIGIFSAISAILYVLDFPVFFAPDFYKLDFSELPALIGAFAFGPVTGVMIEFIKQILKLLLKGTSTAFVGDLANFVIGCSFILPASILYYFKKGKKMALLSCLTGSLVITVFGSLFNAIYLLPAFAALYGAPMEALIGAGTAINPAITNITTFVLFAVAPLNLVKGIMISVITMLVYKPLSPVLKSGYVRKKAADNTAAR